MLADFGASLVANNPGSVAISATQRLGFDIFLRTLADRMRSITTVTELFIPYDRGDVLASVHREGEVVLKEQSDEGTLVRVRLSDASAGRLRQFATGRTTDNIGAL